ncbi:MAG: endolytic transglycosylase MltG [Deltaproteobacteria bacterium]|nr:endolytic transglycosylase MltG [Candidatus Tharpella sp.]
MRRHLFILLIFTTLAVGLTALVSLDLYRFAHQAGLQPPKFILIETGSSLKKIARQLQKQKLVSSSQRFIILNRLLQNSTLLKAGEYRIEAAASPLEIIETLKQGRVFQRRISIPEGFTLRQIGARLQARGLCQNDEFIQLTSSLASLKNSQVAGPNLEGYLFPNTYNYSRQTSCRQIVEQMLSTGKIEFRKLLSQSPDNTLNRHQILTLASLIQKEAGNNDEMPLIASVFHNRLQRKMRLASDPTTIYALGKDFDGNLRRRDLQHPSPYNTYRHHGLPPGPICSPGTEAIRAAINPDRTDYLYFVSRNNGQHQFSRTLKKHNQAVRKYQLKR